MDCVFCQRTKPRFYGRWYSRVRRCSGCGAFYLFSIPPIWPLPPSLVRAQWQPIKLPHVADYYAYVGFLRMLFQRLRHGANGPEILEQASAGATMCDLIRFRDDAAHERLLRELAEPVADILQLLIEQAKNPAIEMPDPEDLPKFHAICDFASWGLTQVATEQMDKKTVQYFGGDLHNFPRSAGEYGTNELLDTWGRALKGELPSPGRLAIRARMHERQAQPVPQIR